MLFYCIKGYYCYGGAPPDIDELMSKLTTESSGSKASDTFVFAGIGAEFYACICTGGGIDG